MTPSDNRSSALVKELDRRNVEWQQMSDMWECVDLLYEGGVRLKQNSEKFLIKRPKELYDVYQERSRRFTYQNLISNCIGWYISKLFQREPQIDGNTTDDRWDRFMQDCDRSGTTFVSLSNSLLETAMKFRRAFVLVDTPRAAADAPVATRADEKAQGLDQPYLVLYDPRNVINWSLDQYGNLEWVIIKTIELTQPGPLAKVEQSAHWYVFDRQTYRHYRYTNSTSESVDMALFFRNSGVDEKADAKAELVDEGLHALAEENRVPVRVFELPMHLWFANRVYLHLLEHVDQKNGYSWKLFMTAHPQLVIQSEKEISGKTLSEVGFLQIEPEAKICWLEPDGQSLTESRNYIETLREEIYRDFHLQAQGKSSTATADGASGYSKEQDMAPAVDMLNAIGDRLRAAMQLVLTDYKAAAGLPVDTPETIPDVNGFRFETKPALQDITVAEALDDAGVLAKSPTLEKVVDRNIALSVADGQNEETKAKIISEIEAAPTRTEFAVQQQQQQQAFQQKLNTSLTRRATGDVAKQEAEAVSE